MQQQPVSVSSFFVSMSAEELRRLAGDLLAEIASLKDEKLHLQDEIARLKGLSPRPTIAPSGLDDVQPGDAKPDPDKKRSSKGRSHVRNGGGKSLRTSDLHIDKEKILKPENIPAGSRFKGRKRYVVQDLTISAHVTRYHRERYVTPDGQTILAPLPPGLIGHYGPNLISFVLFQHYEQKVPEPKILSLMHAVGIKMSTAQLNDLLIQGKDTFHAEKDAILRAGLEVARSITVDDTSARHKKQNHITTHIGNEAFAWFETTDGKSRRNFLELILHGGDQEWRINDAAIAWWEKAGLPASAIAALTAADPKLFTVKEDWDGLLDRLEIAGERTRVHATEGALWGAIHAQGLLDGTVIVSDGAPQFAVGLHARCWVHAERHIQRLICVTDEQRHRVDRIRKLVWDFYSDLKLYKQRPDPASKKRLRARFDRIFNRTTGFATLDAVLARIFVLKTELLLVLDRPDIPLHTNESESDIRSRVDERKISGCTRSDEGKRCNDTFASISKTLRKHGRSFLSYLSQRIGGVLGRRNEDDIPQIPDLIRGTLTA